MFNIVDKPIIKLIFKPNIICLVVGNIYFLDNVHKLIYKFGIYSCVNMLDVVDKPILRPIYESNILCLVVENIFLVDNAHKIIYEC